MDEINVIIWYLVGVNVIGFVLMRIDKRKAIKKEWRIPERTFWGIALLGGALGSLIGMNYFRHKTKHNSFKIGMPFLVIINIVSIGLIL